MPTKTRPHIKEDTDLVLKDGVIIWTKYNAEQNRHFARCDVCEDVTIKLPPTADPNALESHRNACKQRQVRQAVPPILVVKEASTSGQLHNAASFHTPARPISVLQGTSINITPLETVYDCPGQWVYWIPGSIWKTYPFRIHETLDTWKPVSIDDKHNGLILRAKSCWKKLPEVNGDDTPCGACQSVPQSQAFKVVVERAQNAQDHTPWLFLTDLQKEELMRRMAMTIRRLRTQVRNLVHVNINDIVSNFLSRLIT